MKKSLLSLFFLSSIMFVWAQDADSDAKNEYALSVMPLFQYGSEKVNHFGMYRRHFGKNALRLSFAANSFTQNLRNLAIQNSTFIFNDSSFHILQQSKDKVVFRLQAGYERHFLGKYPNIDAYIGADAFVGLGNQSYTSYRNNFYQSNDSTYQFHNEVNDMMATIQQSQFVFQAGVIPVLGMNVGIGKHVFLGAEMASAFYIESQKNLPKYPTYKNQFFDFELNPRILFGLRF